MKVTVYQINSEKMQELYGDPRGGFEGLQSRMKWYPHMFDKDNNLKMEAYEVVFDMNIEGYVFFHDVNRAKTDLGRLNTLFTLFNNPMDRESLEKHFGFTGYSMSVGNVVRLEFYDRGKYNVDFWYCDSIGWEKITPVNDPLAFKVGDGATLYIGTDRYPAHITRISESGKTVWIKRADFTADKEEGHDYFGSQKWKITPDPDRAEEKVYYSKKRMRWEIDRYTPVTLKGADAYQDPHF